MEQNRYYLAFDLGASSGRAILGTVRNGRLELEEIHRFKNYPYEKDGHYFWDFRALLGELETGLKKAAGITPDLASFSIDTWGVDYALFRGHECEKEICTRLLNFFDKRRPYLSDYAVDGTPYPRQGRNATPGIIAMNAAATQVLDSDNPLMKDFVKDLAALSVPYRFWRYYDGMLYIIGLLATAGKIEF